MPAHHSTAARHAAPRRHEADGLSSVEFRKAAAVRPTTHEGMRCGRHAAS
jgi:hypothetical protein